MRNKGERREGHLDKNRWREQERETLPVLNIYVLLVLYFFRYTLIIIIFYKYNNEYYYE